MGNRVGKQSEAAWGAWGAWGGPLGPPHMPHATNASPIQVLEEVANRVRRLSPDRRDPERFHIEKDELAAELRRLARAWR